MNLTQKLIDRFLSNDICWTGNIPDCVLYFDSSRYDVKEQPSNDKCVPIIWRCNELATLIFISACSLIFLHHNPKCQKLIFKLTFYVILSYTV
jgi:hypothetical protein